jgi:uncharacterized linocin/CFP29 family protein
MKSNRDNSHFKWDADSEKNNAIWKSIDDAVSAEANSIRVLKQVFMAQSAPATGPIFVEQIDSDTLAITGSTTKDYVELSVQFSLSQTEVDQEGVRKFGRYKATEAATKIALAEDMLFLQGAAAVSQSLPKGFWSKRPRT